MNREEIKAFVIKALRETSRVGGLGDYTVSDVLQLAYSLHDEIAKQNIAALVDQLQKEGWEMKEVHTTHKIWGPDDTYENLEFQVFKGPGRYQVFIRRKPGETNAQGDDPNGNPIDQ